MSLGMWSIAVRVFINPDLNVILEINTGQEPNFDI